MMPRREQQGTPPRERTPCGRPQPIRDASRMGGTQIRPGGVIEKPAPLDVSNVMIVCPACNRPTRIGTLEREVRGKTVRVRVCKRADCHGEIDR